MDRTRGVAEAAVMSVACAESRIMEVTVCLGVRRRVILEPEVTPCLFLGPLAMGAL